MSDFLAHHGIKGQKWGVRRYQNPDGTLTEAGRIRLKGNARKEMLTKEQVGIDIAAKQSTRVDYGSHNGVSLKKGETVNHVTPLDFKELRDGQDLFVSATPYDKDLYKSFLTMMMKHKGFGLDSPIKEVELKLKKDLKAPSSTEQRRIFDEFYKANKDIVDSDMNSYYSKSKRPTDNYEAYIKTMDSSSKLASKTTFYDAIKSKGFNAVFR